MKRVSTDQLQSEVYTNTVNLIIEPLNIKISSITDINDGAFLPKFVELLLNEKISGWKENPKMFQKMQNINVILKYLQTKDNLFKISFDLNSLKDLIGFTWGLISKFYIALPKNDLMKMISQQLNGFEPEIPIKNMGKSWTKGIPFIALLSKASNGEIPFEDKGSQNFDFIKESCEKLKIPLVLTPDCISDNPDENCICIQSFIILKHMNIEVEVIKKEERADETPQNRLNMRINEFNEAAKVAKETIDQEDKVLNDAIENRSVAGLKALSMVISDFNKTGVKVVNDKCSKARQVWDLIARFSSVHKLAIPTVPISLEQLNKMTEELMNKCKSAHSSMEQNEKKYSELEKDLSNAMTYEQAMDLYEQIEDTFGTDNWETKNPNSLVYQIGMKRKHFEDLINNAKNSYQNSYNIFNSTYNEIANTINCRSAYPNEIISQINTLEYSIGQIHNLFNSIKNIDHKYNEVFPKDDLESKIKALRKLYSDNEIDIIISSIKAERLKIEGNCKSISEKIAPLMNDLSEENIQTNMMSTAVLKELVSSLESKGQHTNDLNEVNFIINQTQSKIDALNQRNMKVGNLKTDIYKIPSICHYYNMSSIRYYDFNLAYSEYRNMKDELMKLSQNNQWITKEKGSLVDKYFEEINHSQKYLHDYTELISKHHTRRFLDDVQNVGNLIKENTETIENSLLKITKIQQSINVIQSICAEEKVTNELFNDFTSKMDEVLQTLNTLEAKAKLQKCDEITKQVDKLLNVYEIKVYSNMKEVEKEIPSDKEETVVFSIFGAERCPQEIRDVVDAVSSLQKKFEKLKMNEEKAIDINNAIDCTSSISVNYELFGKEGSDIIASYALYKEMEVVYKNAEKLKDWPEDAQGDLIKNYGATIEKSRKYLQEYGNKLKAMYENEYIKINSFVKDEKNIDSLKFKESLTKLSQSEEEVKTLYNIAEHFHIEKKADLERLSKEISRKQEDIHKKIKKLPKGIWNLFTTLNHDSMSKGRETKIDDSVNLEQLEDILWSQPELSGYSKYLYTLIVYLPGGCRFKKGTLEDFLKCYPYANRFLYVVVSQTLTEAQLAKKYETVTDIRGVFQTLLSPLFPSSEEGLCTAASLMGYFSYSGAGTEMISRYVSEYSQFTPFGSTLYLISNRYAVQGHHLVTVCACFLTLLRKSIPESEVKNENLWENALPILYKLSTSTGLSESAYTVFESPFGPDDKYFAEYQDNEMAVAMLDDDFKLGIPSAVEKELPTLSESKEDYENNTTGVLKVNYALDLKKVSTTTLFHGKKGVSLYTGHQSLKETNAAGVSTVIFPEEGEVKELPIEKIAQVVPGPKQDPSKVKQFISILLDVSYSMGCTYDTGGVEGYDRIDRLSACLELFYKFVHRIDSTLIETKYGFYTFESEVHEISFDTDMWQDIVQSFLKDIEACGGTDLFAALDKAADDMIGIKNKYQNALLRIVVLSDGESGGRCSEYLLEKLMKNGIVVDSIYITSSIDSRLVAISKMTGGSFMAPPDLKSALQIFEKETFFNPQFRDINPYRGNKYLDQFYTYSTRKYGFEDADPFPPAKRIQEAVDSSELVTPLIKAYKTQKVKEQSREKEILKQIRKIAANKDPSIRVFIPDDRMDVWRVLMRTSPSSMYGAKWFYLIVTFGDEYPLKAPVMRFVTPPFHPNINDEGFICNNMLMSSYNRSLSVIEILQEILFMLTTPNYASPIDTARLELFAGHQDWTNPECIAYRESKQGAINERIRASVAMAKDTVEEWIMDWNVDEKEEGISLDLQSDILVPPNFRDPFTHEVMTEPVRSSTGVYYERRTLNRLARQGSNPKGVDGNELQPYEYNPVTRTGDINRPVDTAMATQISMWRYTNGYKKE